MTFEETAKSLKDYEVVRLMVDGLKNPVTEIHMGTFGEIKERDGEPVCIGCAATNALARLAGYTIDDAIRLNGFKWDFVALDLNADSEFVKIFETSINYLRVGSVLRYNATAAAIGMARIPVDDEIGYRLPVLYSDNYLQGLPAYERFADYLESRHMEVTA